MHPRSPTTQPKLIVAKREKEAASDSAHPSVSRAAAAPGTGATTPRAHRGPANAPGRAHIEAYADCAGEPDAADDADVREEWPVRLQKPAAVTAAADSSKLAVRVDEALAFETAKDGTELLEAREGYTVAAGDNKSGQGSISGGSCSCWGCSTCCVLCDDAGENTKEVSTCGSNLPASFSVLRGESAGLGELDGRGRGTNPSKRTRAENTRGRLHWCSTMTHALLEACMKHSDHFSASGKRLGGWAKVLDTWMKYLEPMDEETKRNIDLSEPKPEHLCARYLDMMLDRRWWQLFDVINIDASASSAIKAAEEGQRSAATVAERQVSSAPSIAPNSGPAVSVRIDRGSEYDVGDVEEEAEICEPLPTTDMPSPLGSSQKRSLSAHPSSFSSSAPFPASFHDNESGQTLLPTQTQLNGSDQSARLLRELGMGIMDFAPVSILHPTHDPPPLLSHRASWLYHQTHLIEARNSMNTRLEAQILAQQRQIDAQKVPIADLEGSLALMSKDRLARIK
ncbi:hypothetical protein BDK51DRAFT_35202, partial [Blyttiomyces helicus]